MNHFSEELELYALGMLEPAERAQIDAHVQDCAACCERLATAEATAALLLDAEVTPLAAPVAPRASPLRAAMRGPRWSWGAAAGAAAALIIVLLGQRTFVLDAAIRSDDAQLARMVHSHFDHAQFVSPHGTPLSVKVIYDRAGTWYDIIATDAEPDWYVSAAQSTVPLVRRGVVSTVTLFEKAPLREIDLRDRGGRVVGSVRPRLSAEAKPVGP